MLIREWVHWIDPTWETSYRILISRDASLVGVVHMILRPEITMIPCAYETIVLVHAHSWLSQVWSILDMVDYVCRLWVGQHGIDHS